VAGSLATRQKILLDLYGMELGIFWLLLGIGGLALMQQMGESDVGR